MGGLLMCSGFCIFLSSWAIIQLIIMGVCYYFQAMTLLEDVEPHHEYENYDDFIKITKSNFKATAINCWLTAAIYAVTLVLSCVGLHRAKKVEEIAAARRDDDEYSCQANKTKPMEINL